MTEENEKEKSEMEKFASAALRGPRATVYHQLLAALLVKANVSSDRLKKIQASCEAAFLAKNKEKFDMPAVEAIYKVCNCLIKAEITKNPRTNDEFIHIPWSFPLTEDNHTRYVKPWFTVELHYFPFLTKLRKQKYPLVPIFDNYYDAEEDWNRRQKVVQAIHNEIQAEAAFKKFFIMTEVLDVDSFKALKGEFEDWAINQLRNIQIAIAEQVSPEVYSEAFKLMFGEKPKQEDETESEGPVVPGQ